MAAASVVYNTMHYSSRLVTDLQILNPSKIYLHTVPCISNISKHPGIARLNV